MMVVMAGFASFSFAQMFEMGSDLEHRTINLSGLESPSTPTVVYSAIPGPYVAFAPRAGSLGFDDYTSTSATPFGLNSMRFVGGVTTAGQQLRFDFFDSSTNFVGGFTSTFGSAGNFIWTISGLNLLNITLPTSGLVQISAINGATGQWFLSSTVPSVGTNNLTVGGAAPNFSHRMELEAVPEPATLTAVGLGLAALLRRKKAAKK